MALPTKVLVRLWLPLPQVERWQRFLELRTQNKERALELDAHRVNEAEEAGINPFLHREDRAYSGTSVFGGRGLRNICVLPAVLDLSHGGYGLTNADLLRREIDGPGVGILTFEFTQGSCNGVRDKAFQSLFRKFLGKIWRNVDVWVNPLRPDGELLHTVNIRREQERFRSRFNDLHFLPLGDGDCWTVVEQTRA